MTFKRSPIEEDGKDLSGNGYQLSTPSIRNYNCHCTIRLTLFSRLLGLKEVRNVSPRPKAIFFPLEPTKPNNVVVLVATKVRWVCGAPGLAFVDELYERIYIPGVFVGCINEKDSTSVRMI